MNLVLGLLILFGILLLWGCMMKKSSEENMTGLGLINSLGMNNSDVTCWGPNSTGSNSGGCAPQHHIVF